ncbi:MAG: GNAT family N-acetyltransferase [Bacteriovoracaceae bacterium]
MENILSLWTNTLYSITRFPLLIRFKSQKIVTPTIQVDFENDYYHIKTANTADELLQVFNLRFEIFFQEFSGVQRNNSFFPYDIDLHDIHCDHLIVKDKSTERVIACYRLLSNPEDKIKQRPFYSEGEFVIDDFLAINGKKLELGRACVHKDFRRGPVITLLWKGLMDYSKKCGARYLFGCSSICKEDFVKVPHILQWLEDRKIFIEDYNISVQEKYRVPYVFPETEEKSSERPINSLMYMYIMAGANMAKTMAYDAEMDCLDIFTLIDLTKIPESFERKFG